MPDTFLSGFVPDKTAIGWKIMRGYSVLMDRQSHRTKRRLVVILAVSAAMTIALILILLELIVRRVGLLSFPTYTRDPDIGYYLTPGQSGAFLNRNRWYVNRAGFANRDEFSGNGDGCMLIGDSVVYGGNPVDYGSRVGTLAEAKLEKPVWVGTAGGWSLLNDLAFARSHINEISKVGHTIFVVNNGDLGKSGDWTGELSYPTRRPSFASWYLFKRYFLPHPPELPPIESGTDRPDRKAWQDALNTFRQIYRGKIAVIEYASRPDFAHPTLWAKDMAPLNQYARVHSIPVTDMASSWRASFYADGIHPGPAGRDVIASAVATACKS